MNDALISKEYKRSAAWPRFVIAMKDCEYGEQETLDAWIWFFAGWKNADITYRERELAMDRLLID